MTQAVEIHCPPFGIIVLLVAEIDTKPAIICVMLLGLVESALQVQATRTIGRVTILDQILLGDTDLSVKNLHALFTSDLINVQTNLDFSLLDLSILIICILMRIWKCLDISSCIITIGVHIRLGWSALNGQTRF